MAMGPDTETVRNHKHHHADRSRAVHWSAARLASTGRWSHLVMGRARIACFRLGVTGVGLL